jgi:uncharacterized protein YuzE
MSGRRNYGPAPYISFDADAVAGYIKLTDEPIAETSQAHGRVLLDLDASGGLVGIEVFGQEIVDLGERIASHLSVRDSQKELAE